MNRLAFVLLLIVVACALSLVNAQYKARSLFVGLERAQAEEKQLNQDWSRLQYEQSALGKSSRIAEVARGQLQMSPINPGRTQYLSGNAAVLAQPTAAQSAVVHPEEVRP